LQPDNDSNYFLRGLTRFVQADFVAAVPDLEKSIELGGQAYPYLYLFLARSRAGDEPAAIRQLEASAVKHTSKEWPYSALELLLGRVPPEAALAAAGNSQQCEARFYIGQWHLLRGNRAEALAALRAAADTCGKSEFEYAGAVAELKRLNP
jgi:lipoprotein NlpI